MENTSARLILKTGKNKSFENRHPWLFSGAVERIEGTYEAGDIISAYTSEGKWIAKGFVNDKSQIVLRVLSFENCPIDEEFFAKKIAASQLRRQPYLATENALGTTEQSPLSTSQTNAYRCFHAEGDGISGLVVDRYQDVGVIQCSTKGTQKIKSRLLPMLQEILGFTAIYEKSDSSLLKEEGLQPNVGWRVGKLANEIEILEQGRRYWVSLDQSQKTGFFLDQRENRGRLASLAAGKKVLNCFAYTGGFSVAAAIHGAQTTSVDISENAIVMAKRNFELNQIAAEGHQFLVADVFEYLRQSRDKFDIIILDPPAFMKKKANYTSSTRAYKDINRLAMKRLAPSGMLYTCSCSSLLDWDLFQKILFSAALEAGREIAITGRFGQPFDHPFLLSHPEGEYLRSFLLQSLG